MRKLILLFSLLGLLLSSYGQLQVPAVASSVQTGGYSAEYQAVYDAMTTAPSSSIADAQNTMVVTMVASGAWVQLDVFYVFAQEANGASEALINWINPGTFDATLTGTPAWVTLEGYTGSSGNYIRSNLNPTIGTPNYIQNSASMGAYLRVSGLTGNDQPIGMYASTETYIRPEGAPTIVARMNSTGAGYWTTQGSQGFIILCRPNSGAISMFFNGTDLGDDATNTSTTVANTDFSFLYTAAYPSVNQIAVGFVGGNLTNAHVTSINDSVETYMVSNGKGVQ